MLYFHLPVSAPLLFVTADECTVESMQACVNVSKKGKKNTKFYCLHNEKKNKKREILFHEKKIKKDRPKEGWKEEKKVSLQSVRSFQYFIIS